MSKPASRIGKPAKRYAKAAQGTPKPTRREPQRARTGWKPAPGPLLTRWAKDVNPQEAWPEYPRPQMTRKGWRNLNGLWDYAIRPKGEASPRTFEGKILVPFAAESALSGVRKPVLPTDRLWYRRTFSIPAAWKGQRILLHFGAVDWEATVWVNGKDLGSHRGGYDSFTLDITKVLKPKGEQELVVSVWDPTDTDRQPRGKQVLKPQSIWYTPVTGIWQTVWLEPVPKTHIERLKIEPDVDGNRVRLTVPVAGPTKGHCLYAEIRMPSKGTKGKGAIIQSQGKPGEALILEFPPPHKTRLWSPETPFLYDLTVRLEKKPTGNSRKAERIDEVQSYVGMRKVSLGTDAEGVTRICLNNEPLFMFGPLDQGFWPDGIYTSPTDKALRYDVEMTRRMGFNMARKHIKVEPDRWYTWCDRLGLLVWQDMPSGDDYVWIGKGEITRSPESADRYYHELQRMIDGLYNHPCVVMWVVFNEGWGQFDTVNVTAWTKIHDPSRLVNNASGWNDFGAGDVNDIHAYPEPVAPLAEPNRAGVVGEFGGLGFPVPGHTWQEEKNWGYRNLKSPEELARDYENLIQELRDMIRWAGLSAAVYTQTTDVEGEVNGLMTYDRAMTKIPLRRLTQANQSTYPMMQKHQARVQPVVPTSLVSGHRWRYSTEPPPEGWIRPEFDDSAWVDGLGGFGAGKGPQMNVRTPWTTGRIWLRRTFTLSDGKLANPHLLINFNEDTVVYLNGVEALRISGSSTQYFVMSISDAARAALRSGTNVMAVQSKQCRDRNYIDVGLIDVGENPEET